VWYYGHIREKPVEATPWARSAPGLFVRAGTEGQKKTAHEDAKRGKKKGERNNKRLSASAEVEHRPGININLVWPISKRRGEMEPGQESRNAS